MWFDLPWGNVGYCEATGCKAAVENLVGANGITRDATGKFFVASSTSGRIFVLEKQEDKSLVLTDEIPLGKDIRGQQSSVLSRCFSDRPVDNLAVDNSGAVWGAGTSLQPTECLDLSRLCMVDVDRNTDRHCPRAPRPQCSLRESIHQHTFVRSPNYVERRRGKLLWRKIQNRKGA